MVDVVSKKPVSTSGTRCSLNAEQAKGIIDRFSSQDWPIGSKPVFQVICSLEKEKAEQAT
jgi:hypothetical protein